MKDSSRTEIRIAGFGGQGVVLCGMVLGRAASIYDGKCATFTQNYGPEARGGACAVQIVLRDKTVGYPYVMEPDILAVMSQEAAGKFVPTIKRGGLLICEEDLVKMDREPESVVVRRIPARRIAEDLGQALVQNIVMAGFITATSGVVSAEAVRRSVRDSVPEGTEEINLRALEAGYEYARHH
jgi:2-oxoglutarate ferredoxin oxidoreductase subunit gamma